MVYQNQIKRSKSVLEAVGKTFNKLTIIEFIEFRKTPRGSKIPIVRCRCECGTEKTASLWDIKSGKTKTCGLNHPHYDDRTIPAFNNIYNNSYKGRATKAGIVFDLSRTQFKEICEQACHYCGILPEDFDATSGWSNTARRGKMKSGKYISEWKYNGLDRINPDKGYTMDNVVPCCGICNHAKHTLSYSDFTKWLDRLVKFRDNN